ncbi:hypothetical protein [Paraburkholderia caffeinilytica]|uniref:hypothetical protein n=1 Tax=Paraburkholderia caffeinilytica TaxID=1761016 RepID=UPI0038BC801C
MSTNLGPDLSISDAEIDKWLENFESGIMPAGPSLNLLGMVRGLQFAQEAALGPVCPECAIAAGARFAWLVFQLAKDPMWASKQGIQQGPRKQSSASRQALAMPQTLPSKAIIM